MVKWDLYGKNRVLIHMILVVATDVILSTFEARIFLVKKGWFRSYLSKYEAVQGHSHGPDVRCFAAVFVSRCWNIIKVKERKKERKKLDSE